MSENEMTRWGIGPRIAAATVALSLGTWAAAEAWPGAVLVHVPGSLRVAGAVLAALGLLVWAGGAITVMRAYNRSELVTTGVFALVRHPVYAGWISMILPGLALFTGAWPLLLVSLTAYAIFRRLIHREEDYLEERFGKAYVAYRLRVNAVLPIPRFGK